MLPSDIVVTQTVPWREEEELVVLLAPRYGQNFLGRLCRRLFGDQTIRIKLDELGSHVWKLCNGQAPVNEIAESLEKAFEDKAENARERLEMFLKELYRQGWVSFLASADGGTEKELKF